MQMLSFNADRFAEKQCTHSIRFVQHERYERVRAYNGARPGTVCAYYKRRRNRSGSRDRPTEPFTTFKYKVKSFG